MIKASLLVAIALLPAIEARPKSTAISSGIYKEDGKEHRWISFPAEWMDAISKTTLVFSKDHKVDCFDIQIFIGTIGNDGGKSDDNLLSISFVYKDFYRRHPNKFRECGVPHTFVLNEEFTIIKDYGNR